MMLKLLGRTDINQLIYLYCILLTTTMCTSQEIMQVDTLGGRPLLLDCKITGNFIRIDWLFQRSDSNEFIMLSMDDADFTSDNAGVLTITAVRPNHEGLYRCEGIDNSKTNGPVQLNVTVLGIAWFAGCTNQSECPRPPMNVSQGNDIVINISLFFYDGGFRGAKQRIETVRLRYSGKVIFACISSSDNCAILNDTKFTNRISYTGKRSPWNNITVTIKDSFLNDSGNYEIEVKTFIPNGQSTSCISSPINITITEAVSPSTTHISSSTIITATSTSQPFITSSITSHTTDENAISSTLINTHHSWSDVHTAMPTTIAQSSSPHPTITDSTLQDSLIASLVLIFVLVPAVLFLGALVVIFYVRHTRESQDDFSKEKPTFNGDSIHDSTENRDIIIRLEKKYNSKLEQV